MNAGTPEQPEENDSLETLLREQIEHIEDAGFTALVVQSLPDRRGGLARRIVLLTVSAIGAAPGDLVAAVGSIGAG